MNWGVINKSSRLLLSVGSFLVWIQFAAGANPPLYGTYQVLRKSQTADQVRVRLQLHLANRSSHDLRVRRITLWDFAHPARGGSQACAIALPAAHSADTIQDFTIPRSEYQMWKRGARPRVVLEIAGPAGHPLTQVVRPERVSAERGN